jgi:hypothetical protein
MTPEEQQRFNDMDKALRRLSSFLGNPCIQGEFESIEMGLVEYAIDKLRTREVPKDKISKSDQ